MGRGDCWGGRPPVMAATAPPQMPPGCDADWAFPGLRRETEIPRPQLIQQLCEHLGTMAAALLSNLGPGHLTDRHRLEGTTDACITGLQDVLQGLSEQHVSFNSMLTCRTMSTPTHEWDCVLGRCLGAAALWGVASSLAALRTAGGPVQTVWMCPVPCPPGLICKGMGDSTSARVSACFVSVDI